MITHSQCPCFTPTNHVLILIGQIHLYIHPYVHCWLCLSYKSHEEAWRKTQILCVAGVNGIGLSMVIPSGQSMVADYYPEERRGAAFGALYLTGAVGAMLGAHHLL